MTRQRKNNLLSQTPSYKYSFRLNEEQDLRFRQMLAAAGLEHNRSRFIVKRLFAERFEGIHRVRFSVQERRLFNFLVPYHRIFLLFRQSFLNNKHR